MTLVNEIRWDVLDSVLRDLRYKKDWNCEVSKVSGWKDEVIKFGVNWSAIGTVSTGETMAFIEQLKVISTIVDKLNEMDIIIDYKFEDRRIRDREDYYKMVNILSKYIEVGDVDFMEAFLTGGRGEF